MSVFCAPSPSRQAHNDGNNLATRVGSELGSVDQNTSNTSHRGNEGRTRGIYTRCHPGIRVKTYAYKRRGAFAGRELQYSDARRTWIVHRIFDFSPYSSACAVFVFCAHLEPRLRIHTPPLPPRGDADDGE